ncbi:MAG: UvrD-helicase domain-containing protein [Oligoflexales bacterium]
MNKLEWDHPQNPYDSFMVQASAGSGKTYQLSKRFLHLVASGAHPSQILTITFTVKAANEMRSRIISEASKLLVDRSEQEAFDAQILQFHRMNKLAFADESYIVKPVLSACEVAKSILSATQLLKVSTIDALFKEWVTKFPYEAQLNADSSFPARFNMLDPMDFDELNRKAWLDLFQNKSSFKLLDQAWDALAKADSDNGPLSCEQRIYELFRLRTYLWQTENARGRSGFQNLIFPSGQSYPNLIAVLGDLEQPLLRLAQETKHSEQMQAAIIARDFAQMIALRLLTKDARVHKGTFRAKKQEKLQQEIGIIEDTLGNFFDQRKIADLNNLGSVFYKLYDRWIEAREIRKKNLGILEFNDLTMACYQLFYGEHGLGVSWLLQQSIRHLLLDEFQDTSLLQWSVFQKLSTELLSGRGASEEEGLLPTVFIVGDKKQSIYGFREADPDVMDLAEESLRFFEKKSLPLNASFRTAGIVLDFVNGVFSQMDSKFPTHSTANIGNKLFVPNCGRVSVREAFAGDEENSGVEKEADFIAAYLRQALNSEIYYPVWDKNIGNFRQLQAKDCCILYRNATHVNVFEKALRRQDIAYRLEEKKGFFERCEIQDIMAFFHFLVYPEDLTALAHLLKSPLFMVNDSELYALFYAVHSSGKSESEGYLGLVKQILAEQHPEIAEFLECWIVKSQTLLPHELISQVYLELDILNKYEFTFKGSEGKLARKNLIKLLELSSKLEDEGSISLPQCLHALREIADKGELAAARENADVVTLMTIHKSKGLEFPFVILVETGEQWYKGDRYWLKRKGASPGVSFIGNKAQQPTTQKSFDTLMKKQELLLAGECERLLYVALTRASQFLLISGHKPHKVQEDVFLDRLLAYMREHGKQSASDRGLWLVEQIPTIDRLVSIQDDLISPSKKNNDFQFRQTPVKVPTEIDIIQPHSHATQEKSSNIPRAMTKVPPLLASAVGSFIHEGIEYWTNHHAWDAQEAWIRLVQKTRIGRRLRWSEERWRDLSKDCCHEIEMTISNSKWKGWIDSSFSRESEMSIVHLQKDKLMRGKIDLYLEFSSEVIILDYKTVVPPASLGIGTSFDQLATELFCKDQGYQYQLWLYCKAVKEMHPGKTIRGIIWLTKLADAVELVSIP